MNKSTKITSSLIVLSLLAACTTTSSELKRPAGKASGSVTATSEIQSVDAVVSSANAANGNNEKLPTIEVDAGANVDNVTVQMGDNFSRKFLMCENSTACKEVRPILRQTSNNNSTGTTDFGGNTLIGQVKLSEGTKSLRGLKLPANTQGKRILLMKPDVELYELGVALQEPNAFWTSIANNYVTEISTQYFQKLGYSVSLYEDNANEVPEKIGQDLINLHEDTGISIIQFQQQSISQLPTLSTGKFDWQLGKTTAELAKGYGADYGLFVYLRDSYSSGSRVAAQLLMSVLFGVHVQGGTQVGFASLVNLQTGEIEWFNRIISTTGDLRTFGAAVNATDALYEDIPL